MSRQIRMIQPADIPAVRDIYAPYVAETSVSFEYEPPTLEEFTARVERTLKRYPWLVCEENGEIIGYAYAGALGVRKAYQWSVELSIYVRQDRRRQGLGKYLYQTLLELLTAQGYIGAYGAVTQPNPASDRLHRKMGFERVGVWKDAGYKLGVWRDVGWYEKFLLPRTDNPSEPVSWQELPQERVQEICGKGYI